MSTLPLEQVKGGLHQLGFPVATDDQLAWSIGAFQAGWNLGDALLVDQVAGPKTSAALSTSLLALKPGATTGTASAHFSFSEFHCHGVGSPTCLGVFVIRPLLVGLEAWRAIDWPSGLPILSGYRCAAQNGKYANAAPDSLHLHGGGADVPQRYDPTHVESRRIFSGIGSAKHNGLVQHVDMRGAVLQGAKAHLYAPPNKTGGTPREPTLFIESD